MPPDVRLFECAVLATGEAPEASAVVGDRMDCDVVPAKALGMRTILVRVGDHVEQQPRHPEESPDVIIHSLTQLPEAINALNR
jgi:FMN phosphatase YigB (HAD superfamily)